VNPAKWTTYGFQPEIRWDSYSPPPPNLSAQAFPYLRVQPVSEWVSFGWRGHQAHMLPVTDESQSPFLLRDPQVFKAVISESISVEDRAATSANEMKADPATVSGEGQVRIRGHAPTVNATQLAAPPPLPERPPTRILERVLEVILTRRAYETMIQPLVADAHYEYNQYLLAGHKGRAWWVIIRLHGMVMLNLLAAAADAFAIWKKFTQ